MDVYKRADIFCYGKKIIKEFDKHCLLLKSTISNDVLNSDLSSLFIQDYAQIELCVNLVNRSEKLLNFDNFDVPLKSFSVSNSSFNKLNFKLEKFVIPFRYFQIIFQYGEKKSTSSIFNRFLCKFIFGVSFVIQDKHL